MVEVCFVLPSMLRVFTAVPGILVLELLAVLNPEILHLQAAPTHAAAVSNPEIVKGRKYPQY